MLCNLSVLYLDLEKYFKAIKKKILVIFFYKQIINNVYKCPSLLFIFETIYKHKNKNCFYCRFFIE